MTFIRSFMILSFILIVGSGCSLITDPLGKSFSDVEDARETGVLTVNSMQSPDAAYQSVINLAATKGWSIYNQDDETHKLLLLFVGKRPERYSEHYFGNTSEVGIFISASSTGSKIEVSSWSVPAQKKAHSILLQNIQ